MKMKFERKDKFSKELDKRVRKYFSENKMKRKGDWRLHIKAVFWLSLFTVCYVTLITSMVTGWWQWAVVLMLGSAVAGIGMNIMHDANHGSFSSNKRMNDIIGSVIYLLGVHKNNWKVQHNMLHHTYTNIHNHDEDIAIQGILRFTRFAPWFPWHQVQHVYGWFLYGLLTFKWVLYSDYDQLKRYMREGYNPEDPQKEWKTFILAKVIYVIFFIVLPLLVGYTWWQVLIGFMLMHYVTGFILATVFQLAHINPKADVLDPHTDFVPRGRYEHQLATTVNFAMTSKVLTWLLGGLNHQVEHHLWPTTSHVHYPAIANIVQEMCKKYDKPYYSYTSIWQALKEHNQHLKRLGAV